MKYYASDEALDYVMKELNAHAKGKRPNGLRKAPKGLKQKDLNAAIRVAKRWARREQEITKAIEGAFDSEGRPIGLFDA